METTGINKSPACLHIPSTTEAADVSESHDHHHAFLKAEAAEVTKKIKVNTQ